MLSPIFTIEAITTARRARYFWVRCVYALFLLFILIITYSSRQAWAQMTMQGVANLARDFFMQFTWVQLTAILLLTPAMTAGTIAGELERKTLDYLLVCPLSSASILWGKLGARLLLAGLLVSSGIPVLALAMTLGGIPPLQMLATAAISLATLLAVGALSLGVSVWAVRTRDAILSSYILLVALLVLPTVGTSLRFVNWPSPLSFVGNLFTAVCEAGVAINPFVVAYANRADVLYWALGAYLAFTVIVVAYAGWRLRGLAARRTGAEARRSWRLPRLTWRPALGQQAMLWKEMFIEKTALRWGCLVRLAQVAIFAAILIPTCYNFVDALGRNSRETGEGFIVVYAAVATLTLIMTTARAATLITGERERDTWLTLISTPLTAHEIIVSKILGNLYAVRWPVLFCLFLLLLPCVLNPQTLWYVPWVLLDLAVLLAFCSAWGVQCSLVFASSTGAMWSSVGTLVLVGGGYLMCCGAGFAFFAMVGNSRDAEVLLVMMMAPCIPYLLGYPGIGLNILASSSSSELWAGFVAWILGTAGYASATLLLYHAAVGEFDRRAGRISPNFLRHSASLKTLNEPESAA